MDVPTKREWRKLNSERGVLIDKSIAGSISPVEKQRLEQLQAIADRYLASTRSGRDEDAIRRLEMQAESDRRRLNSESPSCYKCGRIFDHPSQYTSMGDIREHCRGLRECERRQAIYGKEVARGRKISDPRNISGVAQASGKLKREGESMGDAAVGMPNGSGTGTMENQAGGGASTQQQRRRGRPPGSTNKKTASAAASNRAQNTRARSGGSNSGRKSSSTAQRAGNRTAGRRGRPPGSLAGVGMNGGSTPAPMIPAANMNTGVGDRLTFQAPISGVWNFGSETFAQFEQRILGYLQQGLTAYRQYVEWHAKQAGVLIGGTAAQALGAGRS